MEQLGNYKYIECKQLTKLGISDKMPENRMPKGIFECDPKLKRIPGRHIEIYEEMINNVAERRDNTSADATQLNKELRESSQYNEEN